MIHILNCLCQFYNLVRKTTSWLTMELTVDI